MPNDDRVNDGNIVQEEVSDQQHDTNDVAASDIDGTTCPSNSSTPETNQQGNNDVSHDDNHRDDDNNNNSQHQSTFVTNPSNVRKGTISSARFNLLSTMVGGGSLSLPLAFHKSGNGLLGPLFVVIIAAISEFCIRLLISSANILVSRQHQQQQHHQQQEESPSDASQQSHQQIQSSTIPAMKGTSSLESVTSAAFGTKAYAFSMGLVTLLCFFGLVGYSVLLRDMLEPIADSIFKVQEQKDGPTLGHNITMLSIILLVTPLCTLQTITSLQKAGAASMTSILILGSLIAYRSVQCNFSSCAYGGEHRHTDWYRYITLFPKSFKDILDALPLYISTYVCHYNVLPACNDLQNPTPKRVTWLVRSTVWSAAIFYILIGFVGSMYGNCTHNGSVQGNVLLDFDEKDPLLLVGRLCLALTLTMAFPVIVLPARDIVLRVYIKYQYQRRIRSYYNRNSTANTRNDRSHPWVQLQQPLLPSTADGTNGNNNTNDNNPNDNVVPTLPLAENSNSTVEPITDYGLYNDDEIDVMNDENFNPATTSSFLSRLVAAIFIFWTAAGVAACVSSIDVVWDLLGSSLSIILSYLIPCGSFIVIAAQKKREEDTDISIGNGSSSDDIDKPWERKVVIILAWLLVIIFFPMMFISTANAIFNTI